MNRLIRGFCALQKGSSVREITSRTFAYRSDVSIEVLYPNSKPQLYTPPLPVSTFSPRSEQFFIIHFPRQTVNEEKFNGYIPIEKVKITYSRSSGPGGQNGDKVNTKVDLRFHVQTADWIPQVVRDKLLVEVSTDPFLSVTVIESGFWLVSEQEPNQQGRIFRDEERTDEISAHEFGPRSGTIAKFDPSVGKIRTTERGFRGNTRSHPQKTREGSTRTIVPQAREVSSQSRPQSVSRAVFL